VTKITVRVCVCKSLLFLLPGILINLSSSDLHLLLQHIRNVVDISDQEFETVLLSGKSLRFKKNQLLLREGDHCQSDFFVLNGSVRQSYIDDDGKEHVVQFGFANWWISDWHSILHNTPSTYRIEAIQPCEVIQFSYKTLLKLFVDVPILEKYFRIVFQYGFAAQQRRIAWLQQPAAERYKEFISVYGFMEQSVPQALLASYLGITRESLNRIKKYTSNGFSKRVKAMRDNDSV